MGLPSLHPLAERKRSVCFCPNRRFVVASVCFVCESVRPAVTLSFSLAYVRQGGSRCSFKLLFAVAVDIVIDAVFNDILGVLLAAYLVDNRILALKLLVNREKVRHLVENMLR